MQAFWLRLWSDSDTYASTHRDGAAIHDLFKVLAPVGFDHARAQLGTDATAQSEMAGVALFQLLAHRGDGHHRNAISLTLIHHCGQVLQRLMLVVALPINTETHTADAFRRMISSIEVVRASCARSAPTMLVQPETLRIMGTLSMGSMQARNTPRVQNKPSQNCSRSLTVSPGLSSFRVGPKSTRGRWAGKSNDRLPA